MAAPSFRFSLLHPLVSFLSFFPRYLLCLIETQFLASPSPSAACRPPQLSGASNKHFQGTTEPTNLADALHHDEALLLPPSRSTNSIILTRSSARSELPWRLALADPYHMAGASQRKGLSMGVWKQQQSGATEPGRRKQKHSACVDACRLRVRELHGSSHVKTCHGATSSPLRIARFTRAWPLDGTLPLVVSCACRPSFCILLPSSCASRHVSAPNSTRRALRPCSRPNPSS